MDLGSFDGTKIVTDSVSSGLFKLAANPYLVQSPLDTTKTRPVTGKRPFDKMDEQPNLWPNKRARIEGRSLDILIPTSANEDTKPAKSVGKKQEPKALYESSIVQGGSQTMNTSGCLKPSKGLSNHDDELFGCRIVHHLKTLSKARKPNSRP